MYYINPDSISVSPTSWFYPFVSWIPGKFLGWFSYVTLESFGSIAPNALFWAFVASTVTTDAAKKGYGMIMFFTQLATICGTMVVDNYSKAVGLPTLVTVGAILVMLVPFLVQLFLKIIPQDPVPTEVATAKKSSTGFLEGLKLLGTRPYLLGVLVVVTFYEVINTIMEYQMKSMAAQAFTGHGGMSSFIAKSGEAANFLALFFALVGTSFFMRRFGLRFCLLMFPVLITFSLLTVVGVHVMGAASLEMLWAFFGIVVVIKGLSYALNNPSKEVMYIPTSKDVKFKAKGWIDSFGQRSSKGTGAIVTNAIKASPNMFMIGSAISFVLLGIWIPVAFFVGNKNKKLVDENKIIE
jgi:AAA family ATP:ADP antiporter